MTHSMPVSPIINTPETLPEYKPPGPFWNSSISWEKPILYAKTGVASKEGYEATTFANVLKLAAENGKDFPALRVEKPVQEISELEKVDGVPQIPPSLPLDQWKTWTWSQTLTDTEKLAKSLIKAGVQAHDGVTIFGFNSPEWVLSVFGAIFAGGNSAGIYPTDTPAQILYKCELSNSVVMFVDGQKNFDKTKGIAKDLSYLKAIVSWGKLSSTEPLKDKNGSEIKVFTWDKFLEFGKDTPDAELQKRLDYQKPGHSCSLVFTSGTTGNPKAVMLSHDAICFTGYTMMTSGKLGDYGMTEDNESVVSYLPLSHVAGMMVDIVGPLIIQAYNPANCTVYFARPYDLKLGSIVQRLVAVKPTVFLGVPRVWEKMVEKLKKGLSTAKGIKAALARFALGQGESWINHSNFNPAKPNYSFTAKKGFLYSIADRLVLKKIRARLGLEKCKYALTGAAPIHVETQKFIGSLGIIICEAYGLSEGTAATCFSSPDCHFFGCVGPQFPCVDVKVFNVDDSDMNKKTLTKPAEDILHATEEEQGEICFRGRNIMNGYLANPRLGKEHMDEITGKNKKAIDDEGYLHTGDKAAMSKDGFFKITGRYKELIITAGGENIAPVPIEDAIVALSPIISNIVMIGDKRKFNVALVTLKLEGATGEFQGSNKLMEGEFKYLGTKCTTIEEAVKDEKVIADITTAITKTNSNGDVVVSNAAKIQKFMILPRDLCITNQDFTPTLKLKRGYVVKKFESIVDLMYSSKEVYVPFPMDKYSAYFTQD